MYNIVALIVSHIKHCLVANEVVHVLRVCLVSCRVFFTPNRALSGLALVGLPGSEGRLRVVVASQVRGQNIVLLLPFKLAQCPLGYYPPPGASSLPQVSHTCVSVCVCVCVCVCGGE